MNNNHFGAGQPDGQFRQGNSADAAATMIIPKGAASKPANEVKGSLRAIQVFRC
jgi:hypothetical protein